jgi:hypothetical protein
LLIVAIFCAPVLAEEPRPRSKYGDIRLGPIYLSLRMTVTAGTDSNVYNNPAAISDESIAVRPTVEAVLPLTRRARIKADGGIAPQYFHREASQRHTDLFGDFRGEIDVGPLTPFAGLGAARYRQRFSLEIDERLLRRESSNIVGATAHFGRRITVTASRRNLTSTFDPGTTLDGRDVSIALDRQTRTDRLELSVPLTRKTSLVPAADFVQDRFLSSSEGLPPRVRSGRFAAALEFSELAFVTGRVALGVRHFGANAGVEPYDGLFLDVNASVPFPLATRLRLSSYRDVAYSASASAPGSTLRGTYIDSRHQATLAFELPWKLHGRAFAGYAEAKYRKGIASAPDAPLRRDHAWTEGGALLRHFGEHLSLGIIGQHGSRFSPVEGRTYEGNLYGLTGEVRF